VTTPVCDAPPYKVTETGWGEFTVNIRIQFVQESAEKPLTLSHPIKLHHWGAPIVTPPKPVEQTPAVSESTVDAVKTEAGSVQPEPTVQDAEVKPVPSSQTPAAASAVAAVDPETTATPADGMDVDGETEAPAESEAEAEVIVAEPRFAQVSVAASFPVHAWQYDELVFADPYSTFLTIMNDHPPTPLPPKNRRARDQREEYAIKKGGKKTKRSSSVFGTPSVGAGSGPQESQAAPPATVPPGPGITAIGIPGEPGSADVPLEFSSEMEKGEFGRLNDARVHIVHEMDKWR
jgi:YEATS domain-containing protein 4